MDNWSGVLSVLILASSFSVSFSKIIVFCFFLSNLGFGVLVRETPEEEERNMTGADGGGKWWVNLDRVGWLAGGG